MRSARVLVAAAVAVLAAATAPGAALAGDPIMPLSELRPGMECKGYSVIRGTEPGEFDVEILDIVDGDTASDGPRILVRASGPNVEATGVGFGFSGSPIYCPDDDDDTMKNAGAISESLGAYDGLTVLATPIETILGNPPEPPSGAGKVPPDTRSLAGPLTISGLSPRIGEALMKATARSGRPVLASPARPMHGFPPTPPKPGSAVSIGYSTGALAIGGVGTVSYVDGDRVWAFGHAFEGAGRRNLLLQDAYVYDVIAGATFESPGPYKLAAPGHDLGTFTNDALSAIVGRSGPVPATIPVAVTVRDLDTGAQRTDITRVADESPVGLPLGISPLSFVGPLAVSNSGTVMKGSPARISGRMCLRVTMVELPEGVRVCNRYAFGGLFATEPGVTVNLASGLAATDLVEVMTHIDGYRFRNLRVTGVTANLDLRRGADQAFMRRLRLPRSARRGSTVRARLDVVHVGGRRRTLTQRFRIPAGAPRGFHELTLTGSDSDDGAGDIFGAITTLIIGDEEEPSGGDPGAHNLKELTRAIRKVQRWDGVRVRFARGRGRGMKAFRRDDVRLSGRVRATIRIR